MKILLALMLCAVSLGVSAQLPNHVPTDGLIGWWPLNGNANDDGPSTIDGTVFGASPSIDRWGDASGAMSFQDIGDRIELGEIAGNLGLPNSALTISCWFKGEAYPNNGSSSGQLVSAYYGSGDRQIRLEVVHGISNGPGDHLKYYWRCPEENNEPVSTDQFSTSDWNHYVMTVDPMSSEVRITFNGLLVQDMIAPYSPSNDYRGTETRNWMFGSYHPQINSAPHQFVGDLDDIGIWNRALSQEEISVLYNASAPISGCTNTEACNYNEDAIIDDGSCYPCEIPASHCGPGTIWDAEMQLCIGDGSGDINLDGCVQLGDLLDLLAAYGDCGVEESAWQCGDPLEYQGYDYETVQIGEQCWFAENLRAENYSNGDAIASDLGNSEWEAFTEGATTVYNNDPNSFDLYGRLYNSYAVEDSRKLCPFEWKVPSDSDWMLLEMELGMTEEIASMTYHRGLNEGLQLKSSFGWFEGGNGTNVTEFSALPGGVRDDDGDFSLAGERGHWWSSTPIASSLWYRRVDFNDDRIYRWYIIQKPDALSVLILKE